MDKKVSVWIWAKDEKKGVEWFPDLLEKSYKSILEKFRGEKYALDVEFIEASFKENEHIQDYLEKIFRLNFTLDYDFVKGLNCLDVISPEVFYMTDSRLSSGIFDILHNFDVNFIVWFKKYKSKDHIELNLKATIGVDSLYDDLEFLLFKNML